MAKNYYDWYKILSKMSDKELLDIYNNKTYPIAEKKNTAKKILIERGILSPETNEIIPKKETSEIIYASLGARFGNYIIDSIFIRLLIIIIDGILIWNFNLIDIELYFINFVVFFFYYFLFEGSYGRTLGKLITGTKVIDENGQIPSASAILIRTLSRLIPFEAFSFLGSKPLGWHDRFSKTYVVKKSFILKRSEQIDKTKV